MVTRKIGIIYHKTGIFSITMFAAHDYFHKLKIEMPFRDVIIFLRLLENLYQIFSNQSHPSKDSPSVENSD